MTEIVDEIINKKSKLNSQAKLITSDTLVRGVELTTKLTQIHCLTRVVILFTKPITENEPVNISIQWYCIFLFLSLTSLTFGRVNLYHIDEKGIENEYQFSKYVAIRNYAIQLNTMSQVLFYFYCREHLNLTMIYTEFFFLQILQRQLYNFDSKKFLNKR